VETRDAAPADLQGIVDIYNDVIATSTAVFSATPVSFDDRRQWWEARIALGYPVLVAVDASGVTGFATFGDFRSWPGYRHTVEHTVHVRSDRRGQGIGSQLIRALLPLAGAKGKHVMVAGIDAANTGSIRLHERLGFERVGYLPQVGCKFGRWLDLILLQRLLDNAPVPPDS
jgi:phosphinothricin acetyltransferase